MPRGRGGRTVGTSDLQERSWVLADASSFTVREVNALGTALSPEQQPWEVLGGDWCFDVVWGTSFQRGEGVRQMGSQQHWVPAHLHQKTHGAALTRADGLQKLVFRLEGLLDFTIKMEWQSPSGYKCLPTQFSLKPKQQSKNVF